MFYSSIKQEVGSPKNEVPIIYSSKPNLIRFQILLAEKLTSKKTGSNCLRSFPQFESTINYHYCPMFWSKY